MDFAFNESDPDAAAWAEEHAADLVTGMSATTSQTIRDYVVDMFEGDETPADLVDNLLDLFGDEARADLTARTETMEAANGGQREAWAQAVDAGLMTGREKKEWIASANCCDDCQAMDGEQVGIDDDYSDGSDGPTKHPACECTEGLVLEPTTAWQTTTGHHNGGNFSHAKTGVPITFKAFHYTGTGTAEQIKSGNLKSTVMYVSDDHSWASPWLKGSDRQVPVQMKVHLANPVVYTEKDGTFEEHASQWVKSARNSGHDGLIYISKSKTLGKTRQAVLFSPKKSVIRVAWQTTTGHHNGGSKSERAKKSYNPSNRAKQLVARAHELAVADAVNGEHIGGLAPFDIHIGKTGAIEVKTIVGAKNDKITMHKSSLKRKVKFAKKMGRAAHTVAVDARGDKPAYYHRAGVGSFMLHTMTKTSLKGLHAKVRGN